MAWETDLPYGKIGERKFIEDIWKLKSTVGVLNVSNSELFYPLDVDFLVTFDNGTTKLFEIKTDRTTYGNFVYELTSNGNLGCLERSIANYVYYYKEPLNQVYLVDLRALRKHIKETNYSPKKMGDNAVGYLVPLNVLVDEKIAWKGEDIFNGRL